MRRSVLLFAAILLMLISPVMVMHLSGYGSGSLPDVFRSLVIAIAVFLTPLVFFHRNIKLYLRLLLPIALVTPLFLFSTHYFRIPPGFELMVFILQTNMREATEAIHPFVFHFVVFQMTFTGLYLMAVQALRRNTIPAKTAWSLSVVSLVVLATITFHTNDLRYKSLEQLSKSDLLLKYDYPVTLVSGVNDVRKFLKKNNLTQAENFSFGAFKKDSLQDRQVYVLIIGESSRFDRWQVNDYHRETSPLLNSLDNLITYRDVVAGAHYTWVSVPQIITRANPDNYDLQYREKSIIGVFQEAGFYTYWLSNQSDQDVFWSGSITLHARTADVSVFSPTYSPNLEFENIHDGRLLPLLDSILKSDNKNLFIVLHTMGNHWEFSRRYPPEFDVFQPSGYSQSIDPSEPSSREALLNSYDNSIRYADYFIYNVIGMVEANAEIATVMFISDHGEDLYDTNPDRPDFHFRPSAATLKIPLFIWSSRAYDSIYRQKKNRLAANASAAIGSENIFYTLADMANIGMPGFDSTKSFANDRFVPSMQKFYGDDHRSRLFRELPY
ncbi:MAG TPA: phosphoethanolamine transferase [Chryseosolibacter sp.]|nr:phosphoethanolamine transferase [Chryseosolibacter sp.]